MRCFVHFNFHMCVSPQRCAFFRQLNFKKWRAFFRQLNFKKCSHHEVFWTFSLPNLRFATVACIFSTSELQRVLRCRQFLNIFTSKFAFRHSGVQFLMSALSAYLRTRRFNRPTFRLARHTNHWKNIAFRDFYNIWRGCIFFLMTFALLHLLSADLTTLLCFSTVHIVGSLLFKLPLIINIYIYICILHIHMYSMLDCLFVLRSRLHFADFPVTPWVWIRCLKRFFFFHVMLLFPHMLSTICEILITCPQFSFCKCSLAGR